MMRGVMNDALEDEPGGGSGTRDVASGSKKPGFGTAEGHGR